MQTVKDGNLYKAVKLVKRKYWKRETVEYPSGEVKFESSTAGNYSIDLLAGEYEIICVGGGGGGASNSISGGNGAAGGGGSGGYSNETVTLTAGNYIAIVGAGGSRVRSTNTGDINTGGTGGNSSFDNVMGKGGVGGSAYFEGLFGRASGTGGAGGEGSTQNGNSGAGTGASISSNITVSGGVSVYGGYGAGGDGCATNPSGSLQDRTKAGGSGYVKVTCYSEETITPGTAEDYDFYTEETVYKCWGQAPTTIFESSTGGEYTVNLESGNYEITCVGGGGAAAMRGVYDDRGYGWSGGSGAVYKGVFTLPAGNYAIVVGSANNNTLPQGGNTNTLNPPDATTHDSYVQGVVTCGGGGCGHYNPNYVGAAGAAPVLTLTPLSTALNSQGNVGNYNSGGKGSSAGPVINGGASVYQSYGQGQGCRPSEYANGRQWFNGTNGYVRIRRMYQ